MAFLRDERQSKLHAFHVGTSGSQDSRKLKTCKEMGSAICRQNVSHINDSRSSLNLIVFKQGLLRLTFAYGDEVADDVAMLTRICCQLQSAVCL
jgi:hypothetical protein